MRAQESGNASIHRNVPIAVNAGAVIGLARPLFDGCFLAEYDACAAQREFAEMHQVPVGWAAVRGGVLAHRRHHHAIAHGNAAQRYR